jgi:HlyD family secretion protein
MRRWAALVLILVAVVMAGGAWSAWTSGTDVDVVRAAMGPIRQYVDEQGKTRLPRTYNITTPFAGRMEAIELEVGSRVAQGEVVAQMVRRELTLRVEQAQAEVNRLDASIHETANANIETTVLEQSRAIVSSVEDAVEAAAARVTAGEARYDYAQRFRERIERLARTGAQTQDDLDQAVLSEIEARVQLQQDRLVRSALSAVDGAMSLLPTVVQQMIDNKDLSVAVLQAQLEQAQAELAQVQLEMERGSMPSPVDGVILDRLFDEERELPAGEVVLTIGRLDELEVEAEVLTQDAVNVRVGAPAEIYGPTIGEPAVQSTVRRIYPAGFTEVSSLGVEQQRVLILFELSEAQRTRLVDERGVGVDYRVRVRIVTEQRSNVLQVPRSSVFRDAEGNWMVFAVRGGVATPLPVEVGLMNDRAAEIIDGLAEGDMVVLAPSSSLAAGDEVRPLLAPSPEPDSQ